MQGSKVGRIHASARKVEIEELYVAYRKAKHAAFRDRNTPQAVSYSNYEPKLHEHLRRLQRVLNARSLSQSLDDELIGDWTSLPSWNGKNDPADQFYSSDAFQIGPSNVLGRGIDYRPVADAPVDMQVVNALWCITSGIRLDAALGREHVFASHPHRGRIRKLPGGRKLPTGHPLFQFWPGQYGRWQQTGLRRMQKALQEHRRIVAVTMDLKKFYHRLDPSFIESEAFLSADAAISFDPYEARLNKVMLHCIRRWNEISPVADGGEKGLGLPVGWTSSAVLANAALRCFDQRVLRSTSPIYYGRYVDDVFLVVEPHQDFSNVDSATQWLANRLDLKKTKEGLRLNCPELGKSKLVFGESKQKVFCLDGEAGLDLIRPIRDTIRRKSSEYRSFPELPSDDGELASVALLTARDATIEAGAIRRADGVSVRRHGFSLVLRKANEYRALLEPTAWKAQRHLFLAMARRHLATPRGFGELSRYIPQCFALAAATGEWEELLLWIAALRKTKRHTYFRPKSQLHRRAWTNIFSLLADAVASAVGANPSGPAKTVYKKLLAGAGQSPRDLDATARSFRVSDWALRSRLEAWLDQHDFDPCSLVNPKQWPASAVSLLSPKSLPAFLKARSEGRSIDVPSVLLATRTPPISRLGLIDLERHDAAILRGALELKGVPVRNVRVEVDESAKQPVRTVNVARPIGTSAGSARLIVTSLLTTESAWAAAVRNAPLWTAERFENLNRLMNDVARDAVRWRSAPGAKVAAAYLLLPELSIPQSFWSLLVERMAGVGVSVIGGMEYRRVRDSVGVYRPVNEAIIALATGAYPTAVTVRQRKRRPAWGEASLIRQSIGFDLIASEQPFPVYVHGDFRFAVSICSDFTDIQARAPLQGQVDLLAIPEWNPDTDGFSSLIEAGALDMHSFVAQINNRAYGDSRVRVARKLAWERDAVQLKGGVEDFYAVADVDYYNLREFQSHVEPPQGDGAKFKPFPIGFKVSATRARAPGAPRR